jgi:hypothetical protein
MFKNILSVNAFFLLPIFRLYKSLYEKLTSEGPSKNTHWWVYWLGPILTPLTPCMCQDKRVICNTILGWHYNVFFLSRKTVCQVLIFVHDFWRNQIFWLHWFFNFCTIDLCVSMYRAVSEGCWTHCWRWKVSHFSFFFVFCCSSFLVPFDWNVERACAINFRYNGRLISVIIDYSAMSTFSQSNALTFIVCAVSSNCRWKDFHKTQHT